jgi:23S rRNA (guanosine2251-2'-O)-methyltransferase
MGETEYIYGRRAVLEALRSSAERVNKLFIAEGTRGRTITQIRELARRRKVVTNTLPRRGLERYVSGGAHQGVVASVAPVDYADADELITPCHEGKPALLLLLDGITDPQNLGAILRSADAVGVDGVIVPRRRSVGLTPVVAKHSAGASRHVRVARVTNIATTIDALKENGIQTVGMAGDAGRTIYDVDLTSPMGIVIGSEGAGLRPLVRRKCDLEARIPMQGKVSSLNASVAAAVVLYEALRQRADARSARFITSNPP